MTFFFACFEAGRGRLRHSLRHADEASQLKVIIADHYELRALRVAIRSFITQRHDGVYPHGAARG